ncbi:MAG: uracil-DNA glycosylase [Candidatus Sericytochromatia bacterium]
MKELIPDNWKNILKDEINKPYFDKLNAFLNEEFRANTIYPPKEHIFNSFNYTNFEDVKVLLLGQDPYHGAGQAHGLSFSVQDGIALPPSLKNIYKELETDLGIKPSKNGNLENWAKQGILLLNAVLTVREGEPNSHKSKGWEKFTDAIITLLNNREKPLVFLLWGNYARKKVSLIDTNKHIVIEGIHPSPLSASGGFFGSKPFSKINESLKKLNYDMIDFKV